MSADQDLSSWLAEQIPADWFSAPVELVVDREEITLIGTLPASSETDPKSDVKAFREQTRGQRIEIAREIEARTDRKVSWGVEVSGERVLFTHLAAPVMTRLRQPERQVLDTLVAAGVARSRADALAWCVRLVGQHTGDWLSELREAMKEVGRVREAGPDATIGDA